jgi:MbtH protein
VKERAAKKQAAWRIFAAERGARRHAPLLRFMEVWSMDKEEDTREYQVLVNSEEQYSLWLAGQAIPNGWRQVGPRGQKQVCLDYVKEVWTDMRPLSVRKAMEKYQAEQAARNAQSAEASGAAETAEAAGVAEVSGAAATSQVAEPSEISPPPVAGSGEAGAPA